MLLKRVRVLAAKVETSPGTSIAVSTTDATVNCFDVDLQPQIDMGDRDGQGGFSTLPGVPAGRKGRCTFKTNLSGDGAGGVPTWASLFLPACGWVNSAGVFSPKSQGPGSNVKTLTMVSYENGVKKTLRGAMGTFKLVLPAGELARIEWDFMGIYDSQADASILAPTYDTNLPFRYASTTTTVGSYAPKLQELSIDAGNTVIMREDPSDISGYCTALITSRKVVGSMNPEAQLVATYDPIGDWLGSVQRALSATIGNATDKLTIAAPKLQIRNVQASDRGDNQVDQIDFQCNRSSSAGDDELTFTFAAGP